MAATPRGGSLTEGLSWTLGGYLYHTHTLSDLFFGVSSLLALSCVLLSEVALSICLCRHSVASDVS